MKTVANVEEAINFLTKDEDLRQEMWVHYLRGNDVSTFPAHFKKISLECSEDMQLKKAIWMLMKNPPSDNFMNVVHNFTDFEKSIICLIMLGLSVEKIAEYKGIDKVRIRQAISTIRYNSELNGTIDYNQSLPQVSSK